MENKILKIKKRDGAIADFDQSKITNAIFKAITATGQVKEDKSSSSPFANAREVKEDKSSSSPFVRLRLAREGDGNRSKKLSDKVVQILNRRFKKDEIPNVEQIQDIVEEVLVLEGLVETAKSYILYREQRRKIREAIAIVDESSEKIDQYIQELDWQVQENANMTYSLQGLNQYTISSISKKYWLNKIYPKEIREAAANEDFHIHNLETLAPYCEGWDLYDLLLRGFGGVPSKIESRPAKHFRTALGQLVNFLFTLQGESAGANAVSNFDTLLAPFIRYDNLNYSQAKQAMQEFLYNCMVPTRVGFQTPFLNTSIDIKPPEFLAKQPVIIGGKPQKETYGEFQEEMNIFNRIFYEGLMEGDAKGRPFTFPIPTVSITKDFDWDNPALDPMWEATAKYGVNYFSNFIQSDMKPEDFRSMCCRLRLSNKELYKRGGGLFGAAPLTGCYDEKTEILTENGWELFKNLTKEDAVFTLSENNQIELHKPLRLFEYDYEGKMIHFKAKSLDLLVTPNHRMVVDNRRKQKREFVEARDFDSNTHQIPKQSIWEGEEKEYFVLPPVLIMSGAGPTSSFSDEELEMVRTMKRGGKSIYQIAQDFNCNPVTVYNICTKPKYGNREGLRLRYETPSLKIPMDDWLKLFGFWIAEGCTDNENIALDHGYRIVISQTDKKKREEIKEVLDVLPFSYYEEKNNFVICNKQLWAYLRQFGNKYQKFIPKEIKNLSKRQLKILFDWLVKGDGHIRKTNGQINYWTSSKKLADDLQEIILKLGWLGTSVARKSKVSQIKGRKVKAGIVYTIGVQQAKHYRLRKNNLQGIYYQGKVYCCEVPNHTVFVRRNGKVSWCGNSIGVCTINMPRIGYLSKTKKDFFERLGHLMDLAKESLEIKRKALENFMEKGLYPYSKYYLASVKKLRDSYFGNHFATIGLIGMNEALLNFIGDNIASKRGRRFAIEVLDFMRERLVKYQEETGNMYNLEATPGEGSLAPEEKVLISQSNPKLLEIGSLVDEYFHQKGAEVIKTGRSEILPLSMGEMFTYGFNRDNLKIKKYPVTALVRHQGKSMYEIITASGRKIKVTGQHSIFTLNEEGAPQEVLVSDIKKGSLIAIPKKIEMEQINKELNLIKVFKNSLLKDKLYIILPSLEIIQQLTSLVRVKEWVEKHYKDEWKDVKCSWKKSRTIPLGLIYDLNINLERKILESSKIFYRLSKNTKSINILIPLDRKFGFLFGGLLAEGWISERPEFSNTDKNLAEKFLKTSLEVFRKDSGKIYFKKRKDNRKNQYIVVLSKIIGLVFKEFNLLFKSNEKKIPEFLFFAPFECVAGLLEGFYLGDGCLYNNERKGDISVQLSTNSLELVEGLNILLLRFGILTKIREKDKKNQNPFWKKNYILSISGAENLKKFYQYILRKEIAINETNSGREVLPYLPCIIKSIMKKYSITPREIKVNKDSFNRNVRENRISLQYFKAILKKLSKVIPIQDIENLKNLAYSDLYWDRVKEIKELKAPQHVYDLEVEVSGEKVNNFLGGQGLVCLHNTSYRQARTDKEKYPEIITAGTKKAPYYTNSTMLPVNYTDDIFEALKLQDEIQCKYTGGVVLHLFLGERISDIQTVKNLVKKIFENFHLPYITLTPTFSICPTHGYLKGEHFFCPECTIKQPCEVYSRVVGYLRPVNQFNIGKQQEYHERKTFKIPKTIVVK